MESKFSFIIHLSDTSKRFGLAPAALNGCVSLIYLIEQTLRYPPFIRRGLLPKLYFNPGDDEVKELVVDDFLSRCISNPILKIFYLKDVGKSTDSNSAKLQELIKSLTLPKSDFEYTCFLIWNTKAAYVQFDSVVFLDGVRIICELYDVELDQCAQYIQRKVGS